MIDSITELSFSLQMLNALTFDAVISKTVQIFTSNLGFIKLKVMPLRYIM